MQSLTAQNLCSLYISMPLLRPCSLSIHRIFPCQLIKGPLYPTKFKALITSSNFMLPLPQNENLQNLLESPKLRVLVKRLPDNLLAFSLTSKHPFILRMNKSCQPNLLNKLNIIKLPDNQDGLGRN